MGVPRIGASFKALVGFKGFRVTGFKGFGFRVKGLRVLGLGLSGF